jgi:hypothetical protein
MVGRYSSPVILVGTLHLSNKKVQTTSTPDPWFNLRRCPQQHLITYTFPIITLPLGGATSGPTMTAINDLLLS